MIKQKVWQAKIKLSCLLALNYHKPWMLFSYTVRQEKAAVGFFWREENTSRYSISYKHRQRWGRRRHVRQLALTWKHIFFTLSLYLQNEIIISLHLHKPINWFPFNLLLFFFFYHLLFIAYLDCIKVFVFVYFTFSPTQLSQEAQRSYFILNSSKFPVIHLLPSESQPWSSFPYSFWK